MSANDQAVNPSTATGKRSKSRFGCFEVDFLEHEIRKNGVRLHLQHKPFQILELLLRRPGSLVTREAIANHLWPGSQISVERGLNTAVNALRQVLGDTSQSARYIETRAGLGYCFVAPVQQLTGGSPDTSIAYTPGAYTPVAYTPSKHPQHNCVKGHYFLDKLTEEGTHKAEAHFEAAILEEGCSATAYAGLACTWCQYARFAMAPPAIAAAKAREFAINALSNDSQSAAAHIALARVRLFFDWDWKRGCAECLRALEIDAGSSSANRNYALLLFAGNQPAQAMEHIQSAYLADPLSLPIGVDYARLSTLTGRFEGAAEGCWKVLALDPRCWPAQLELGIAYHHLGMIAEARAELENAAACSDRNPVTLATIAYFFGGDTAEELIELARRRYVNPHSLALAHAGAGRTELAERLFDQAATERDPNLHLSTQTMLAHKVSR